MPAPVDGLIFESHTVLYQWQKVDLWEHGEQSLTNCFGLEAFAANTHYRVFCHKVGLVYEKLATGRGFGYEIFLSSES